MNKFEACKEFDSGFIHALTARTEQGLGFEGKSRVYMDGYEYGRSIKSRFVEDRNACLVDRGFEPIGTIIAQASGWRPSTEYPKDFGFYWVKLEDGGVDLAYYTGDGKYQTAESAGDREGLGVEWYIGVTHWVEATPPVGA